MVSEGHGDNEGRPQYVDDDICHDPLHDNKLVAVYAAAVRKEGGVDGTIIGVLGVVFDWETQSQTLFGTRHPSPRPHGSIPG